MIYSGIIKGLLFLACIAASIFLAYIVFDELVAYLFTLGVFFILFLSEKDFNVVSWLQDKPQEKELFEKLKKEKGVDEFGSN